jgi:hypothetical protein
MVEPLFTFPGLITGRTIGFLLVILIFVLAIYYMGQAKSPYIRRVPALDAIEDAVGRSTEMGKPVVCSFGCGGFEYWTIAGLSILGYVAKLCAETDTRLIVPTGGSSDSYIVREAAVDLVRNAYTVAGKSENFSEEDMPFLSGEQYAYTPGYVGILVRERPGATIMTGSHWSEAMNIAEMSNAVGSITITAGCYTSNMAALACASDYVMLGEEQPAAGAYLSRDPSQLASIRVQDIYKFIAIGLMILGLIAINAGSDFIKRLISS